MPCVLIKMYQLIFSCRAGLITSTAKTLDLLRQNLQKCINKEIDTIVKQYLDVGRTNK